MKHAFLYGSALAAVSVGTFGAAIVACGGSDRKSGFDDENDAGIGETGPIFVQPEGGPTSCKGLQCQVVACTGGTKTTITGRVVAPTPAQFGKPDPIYNAILYVPNAELADFPQGVSCDKCGAVTSGEPIVTALSKADGTFTLEDVPAGDDIPVVIQVGRWRRKIIVPKVVACEDTKLAEGDARLPRNKSEGDIR